MALTTKPRGADCARFRILAGLSAPQAAASLGCTATHLRNVENGESGASPRLLKRMADLYGVEMESLFDFVEGEAA